MAAWQEVTRAAPEIAALARARIEATGLALLATIRADGSPRISGIEPMFTDADLWLGSMPGARKGDDLRRDPRLALHNATVDKDVSEGDVKIAGVGVEVVDEPTRTAFRQELESRTGFDPGTDFDLFRVDVREVATIRPGGDPVDHLVIESWRDGESPRRVERR